MTQADTLAIKSKYKEEKWEKYALREGIAKSFLALLGVRVEACGNGTGSSEYVDHFHVGEADKFDFYAPDLDLWFEVTGTEWTKADSEKRYPIALLPVQKAKVDSALDYGLDGKLFFMSINDVEGEVRFLSCRKVMDYPRQAGFEHQGGDYYMIPWHDWLKPAMVHERFLKALAKRVGNI